jgi:predicted MFS family arabinose efflux permease
MVVGVTGLSLYPLMIANTHGMPLYLAASVVGGAAWSLIGGVLANYLLELAPGNDRPAHLAWYNLAFNAGIVLGSLTGPILSGTIGIRSALMVGFALRLIAAGLIWLTGKRAMRSLTPVGQTSAA